MTYQAQDQLFNDFEFQARSRSAAIQQAGTPGVGDVSPAAAACAEAVQRGDANVLATFTRLDAAGAGIADKVDNGDGTIDQAAVTDADLLSLTQANFAVVAGLYFDDSGAAKP